jgi:spore germination protein YaaH
MMDADEISESTKQTAQEKSNHLTHVCSQPVDGINIDVEYAGEVTQQLRDAYTAYIVATNKTLEAVDPNIHLSIDVFADTAQKKRIWDIPALAPHLDHIVVMTYDFFRSSSSQSGPVAPVFGSEKNRWDTDIVENLKLFIQQAPPEKILLGIPFYGYEWRTV